MTIKELATSKNSQWFYFIPTFALFLAIFIFYGINFVNWRNSPDFGWRAMYEQGPNIAADVFPHGEAAGLRTGDEILAINNQPYTTFEELFFQIRNEEPDSLNTYTIKRDNEILDITIVTGKIGFFNVLKRSGPLFLMGFVYFMIGTLVFFMKPKARESWLFFLMASGLGAMLCYQSPSDLLRPLWLFSLRNVIEVFMPAPMLYLPLRFPKKRSFVTRFPWLVAVPYLMSLTLLIVMRSQASAYWNIPPALNGIYNAYIMLAVLTFLVSMVWNYFKDLSAAVRIQSQTILIGIFIGFFIPVADLLMRSYINIYLFPDPVFGFTFFLTFFPLSIGYTIVKYDLFAIDALIKRTYGYILTTGVLAGLYALFVTISNVAFGRFEITQSKTFPLVFMLAVVFFFNPIRNRVQRIIDRLFYRLEYDYQETVQKISETMRSLLKLDEIGKSIMDTALGTMFIDCGCVLLMNQKKENYQCLSYAGECTMPAWDDNKSANAAADEQMVDGSDNTLAKAEIPGEDPFVKKIAERKRAVTIYDVQEDPFFEDDRMVYEDTFIRLSATLIVPLIYEDRLIGMISLGQKKSGKFYRREDVNLLNILANQGAVAIENALMIEEVIEKERMEEELNIAKDLQVSMLPAENPEIDGLEIASYSMSAREVGGDFYDFIDMGEEKVGMLIGDVTGKSVSGALVMSASRSIFRMLSEEDRTVADIMIRANRRTKKDIISGMFVALLYAVVDAKARTVDMCSAGQTQPIHLAADTGDVHLVETEGDTFPLGILEDVEYVDTHVTLKPGDTVVFYTDGIVEAMNPAEELYGFDRLEAAIQNSSDLSAQELLDKILDQVNTFAAGSDQHDDITVIIIKVAA